MKIENLDKSNPFDIVSVGKDGYIDLQSKDDQHSISIYVHDKLINLIHQSYAKSFVGGYEEVDITPYGGKTLIEEIHHMARNDYFDQMSQDNEGGHGQPIGHIQGYTAGFLFAQSQYRKLAKEAMQLLKHCGISPQITEALKKLEEI